MFFILGKKYKQTPNPVHDELFDIYPGNQTTRKNKMIRKLETEETVGFGL